MWRKMKMNLATARERLKSEFLGKELGFRSLIPSCPLVPT